MNATQSASSILVLVIPLLACKAMQRNEKGDEPVSDRGADTAADPSETAKAVALDKVYARGEKVELDGMTVWVESWQECKKNSQNRWMGLLAYYEGTGAAAVQPGSWKAYDEDGITYDRHTGVTFGECKPALASTSRVAKGDKKKGWVYFGVPDGAKGFSVKYTHRPPRRKGQPQAPDQVVEFKLE